MPLSLKGTKMHKEKFGPLSPEEERTGRLIVNTAYTVHKTLVPGLLENYMKFVFVLFFQRMIVWLSGK